MAPQKRSRRYEDEDEIVAVESASSSLRHDIQRKKARISINGTSASKVRSARKPRPSSSSDSEDGLIGDEEENSGLPNATQYEILRDGDFQHLRNPVLDDQIQTQKFLRRRQLVGDNHAADNAIIQEITCYNFMCHTHLNVKLGPLINFVVGMNGSGKSAVLTAITLCLGGKASSTNRGSSLKSLIKSGADQASLVIKLKNEGNDAYQRDIYGNTIIIERNFSRSGTSGYKLKNENGRTVTSKKGDVDELIEYYQLQVENPMNVLTQDAAKSFITSSTPSEKYDFFVKGVQLEALDNDYKLLCETCDTIAHKLENSASDIEALKKSAEAAIEKSKLAREREGMRAKLKNISRQAAWSQVGDVERKLEEKEALISEAQNQIDRQQQIFEEKSNIFEQTEQLLERSRENARHIDNEMEPLRQEEVKAKETYKEATGEAQKVHTESRTIRASLVGHQKKVNDLNKGITEETQRLADINGGSRARMQAQIQDAENALVNAKMALDQNENELPRLDEKRVTAQQELKKLETVLNQKRQEMEAARKRLQELQNDRPDVMAGYDPNLPHLLTLISREHRFREPPVGPMGKYIKLLNPVWSNLIETQLNSSLSSFIVTSKHDQVLLMNLIKQSRVAYCPVIISSKRSPIDTTGNEPDPQFETILRVLEIENDLVRNQLIINQAIEQSILIPKGSAAYEIMFRSGSKPRNVRECYSLNESNRGWGIRYGWIGQRKNLEDQSGIRYHLKKPRMKTNSDSAIKHQEALVAQLTQEKSKAENDYNQARGNIQKCQNAIVQHKKEFQKLKVALQRAEETAENLQTDLDRDSVGDGRLEALKTLLIEAESNLRIDQDSYGNVVLEKERLNAIAEDKKRLLDEAKGALAEQEAKLKKANGKVQNHIQARKVALEEKNLAETQVEDAQRLKAKAIAKRDQQAEQVLDFTNQASRVSARVPIDEGETSASLGTKVSKLKKTLEEYKRQQGADDNVIHEAALEADQIYKNAKAGRKEIEELLDLLKRSFQKRIVMFRKFQQHISSRSRINFNYLLSERAFRGKLTIDHKTKKLDVHVEPDETTKSGKGRQTKTLSGGEKSFSSICLLLSLWEAMGAPLRCLDEFDVFMDDVNRDVSTKMIISAARRSVGRQFILITPKALGAGAADAEDVHIIKLIDPRAKGQARIDEMMQEG
ncbi:hypothetical protein BGZ60DRAFT_491271 [Tricladium varicosporioides]|nr:hypothetical protein BGZ60DRAFT_491271 [Hymenoscyphus varicosporioides]